MKAAVGPLSFAATEDLARELQKRAEVSLIVLRGLPQERYLSYHRGTYQSLLWILETEKHAILHASMKSGEKGAS